MRRGYKRPRKLFLNLGSSWVYYKESLLIQDRVEWLPLMALESSLGQWASAGVRYAWSGGIDLDLFFETRCASYDYSGYNTTMSLRDGARFPSLLW